MPVLSEDGETAILTQTRNSCYVRFTRRGGLQKQHNAGPKSYCSSFGLSSTAVTFEVSDSLPFAVLIM